MIDHKIVTVGDLIEELNHYDPHDLVVYESKDDDGNVRDLHSIFVDVIDGIRLQNGEVGREIRICQGHE